MWKTTRVQGVMSNEQQVSRASSKSKEDSDLAYDTIAGSDAPVDRHDVVIPGQGGRASDEDGIDPAIGSNFVGSATMIPRMAENLRRFLGLSDEEVLQLTEVSPRRILSGDQQV